MDKKNAYIQGILGCFSLGSAVKAHKTDRLQNRSEDR